jgi:hypothetical protein
MKFGIYLSFSERILFFPTRFTRIIFGVVSIISIFLVLVNCQSDTLAFTGVLTSGQSLTSADGYYQLILHSSGALIGYSVSDSATFWTAGPSNGSPAGTATLSGTKSLPATGRSAGSYKFLLWFAFLKMKVLIRLLRRDIYSPG